MTGASAPNDPVQPSWPPALVVVRHAVVDRIIDHLKLTFVADKPPPQEVAFQELLMDADPPVEYST